MKYKLNFLETVFVMASLPFVVFNYFICMIVTVTLSCCQLLMVLYIVLIYPLLWLVGYFYPRHKPNKIVHMVLWWLRSIPIIWHSVFKLIYEPEGCLWKDYREKTVCKINVNTVYFFGLIRYNSIILNWKVI